MTPSAAVRATTCPFCKFSHPVSSIILDHIWAEHTGGTQWPRT